MYVCTVNGDAGIGYFYLTTENRKFFTNLVEYSDHVLTPTNKNSSQSTQKQITGECVYSYAQTQTHRQTHRQIDTLTDVTGRITTLIRGR